LEKLSISVILQDFRMGEPNRANLYYLYGGHSPNWNILRKRGKEIKWDSLSSDERNGISLNELRVSHTALRSITLQDVIRDMYDIPTNHICTEEPPGKVDRRGWKSRIWNTYMHRSLRS